MLHNEQQRDPQYPNRENERKCETGQSKKRGKNEGKLCEKGKNKKVEGQTHA